MAQVCQPCLRICLTHWPCPQDPVWIVFTCCSLVPVAAATPIIFLCIFLIIDKTDTFQLMSFILQFKGSRLGGDASGAFAWAALEAIGLWGAGARPSPLQAQVRL